MKNKIAGSLVLDSLIALMLLGAFLSSWALFNQENLSKKKAKKLAAETLEYATFYAQYMNYHYQDLLKQNGVIVLTKKDLGNYWNSDLAGTNFLGQTPCVVIAPNNVTHDLEAVMYYVGGKTVLQPHYAMIIRQALVSLGGVAGLFRDNEIVGNSGWKIAAGSPFLTNYAKCNGGNIADNSLVINIDLLSNWNQNLQPSYAIAKEQDDGNGDIRTLPGHLLNANTLKSNLNFTSGHGVLIDQQNQAALKVSYGEGDDTATLGMINHDGNAPIKLVADSIMPTVGKVVGEACNEEELGKIVADRSNDKMNSYLNRSGLVCTKNTLWCGEIDKTSTCYLPMTDNEIVFRNDNQGIQNAGGVFICPQNVPFALNVKAAIVRDISPIIGNLSGYGVIVGYKITNSMNHISQVTCSTSPDYQITAQPQS